MGWKNPGIILFLIFFIFFCLSFGPNHFNNLYAQEPTQEPTEEPIEEPAQEPENLSIPAMPSPCIAFNPYVGNLDPNTGPHPSHALINTLLDKIVKETSYRCIMTYGVLNGLDYTFTAAKSRGIKVIAIIWLDKDKTVNNLSIQKGISSAKAFPSTIVRISCGSEFRTRNGTGSDSIIRNCISKLKTAGVTQPITSIDTWWEWCNRSYPCQKWSMANYVSWIGVNVFPWWENKYSGIFPCTPASNAGNFNIARLRDVKNFYPGRDVVLTEFGWPAGPSGYKETNLYTGQKCGVASEANQSLVISKTLIKLKEKGWAGIVFESFRENWKSKYEGPAGPYWGICKGSSPYTCKTIN